MTPRLFSVPSFRFSLVDPASAIGKWSRVATFGPKSKDGSNMVFDATTLGQMVDNAAARGDRIAICNDHASAYPETRDAPALGFFHALAVVASGQVVKHWALDGGQPPSASGMEDGLYARLGEVTPRGADPIVGLANYRTLSPMFSENGKNEVGEDIGFSLFDVAATNVPFQGGAEIMFHGAPSTPVTMRGDTTDLYRVEAGQYSQEFVGATAKDDAKKYVDYIKRQKGGLDGYMGSVRLVDALNNRQLGKWRYGSDGKWDVAFSAPSPVDGAHAMARESRGHIAWLDGGQREAYEQSGEVYIAPANAPIDLDGYRQGGRWECSRGLWDRSMGKQYKTSPSSAFSKMSASPPVSAHAAQRAKTMGYKLPQSISDCPVRADVRDSSGLRGRGSVKAINGNMVKIKWDRSGVESDMTPAEMAAEGYEVDAQFKGDGMSAAPRGNGATNMAKLTGHQAIEAARRSGKTLNKYEDPTEEARSGLSVREAEEIAREDPSLIWIEMSRMSTQVNPESSDLMARMGIVDGAPVADKMAKYGAYAMGDASPDDMKAMADDLDKTEDPAAKAMAAKMRKFALPFDGKETPEEKAEVGKLAALARTLGVPPTVAAIEAAVVPMSQFSALQGRLSAIEAERAAEKKSAADQKVSELVNRAVAGGYPADQKDALARFARADFGGAEALVVRHVSQNAILFTSVSRGRGSSAPSVSGSDVVERGAVVSFGQNLADAIKAYRKANPKKSYEDAASEVAAARPELAASYFSYGRQ